MDLMRALESEIKPGNTIPNIALLIHRNVKQFGNDTVYSEKINDKYKGITWIELHNKIRFITNNLRTAGFAKGDKMVLFSRNRLEMLLIELAVMAYGGIAVPIFYNFKREKYILHSLPQYNTNFITEKILPSFLSPSLFS